jgi:unsaturated rhamnogalacturonyl hydrolase
MRIVNVISAMTIRKYAGNHADACPVRRRYEASVLLCGVAPLGARGVIAQNARATAAQESESRRRVEKATTAAMAMQRRDWEQGIFAQAMLEADNRKAVALLTKAAIVQRVRDGRLAVVVSGSPTDPSMGGEACAPAAEWTGDQQIQQAVQGLLDWIRNTAPRAADGALYHSFGGPEMWSDGFNCAPPFLAAMGFYDEALAQIEGYRKRLWNLEAKLLSHIWDDGKQQFKDKHFRGGGNGWAAAGLARVIRRLPRERRPDRERLAAFAKDIVDGCLARQRSDGLFHNVVDQPRTPSSRRTSLRCSHSQSMKGDIGRLASRSLSSESGPGARRGPDEDGRIRLRARRLWGARFRSSGNFFGRPVVLHHDGGGRRQGGGPRLTSELKKEKWYAC